MSAMETTFSVRTDGDNDAMLVPDGIETVVVNENAERVIIPEGVQIIRLQMPHSDNKSAGRRAAPRSRSRSPDWNTRTAGGRSDSPIGTSSYGDMMDQLVRAKRSVAPEGEPAAVSRRPAFTEKSLSLPSCPPTPPGSRSATTSTSATDTVDLAPTARLPPLAVRERDSDIFDERTLEADKKHTVVQQPAPAAAIVGNGKAVHYTADTERHSCDPLMGAKLGYHDSFGWREEFQHGEAEHNKPAIEKLGRACADVLCCWMGI